MLNFVTMILYDEPWELTLLDRGMMSRGVENYSNCEMVICGVIKITFECKMLNSVQIIIRNATLKDYRPDIEWI